MNEITRFLVFLFLIDFEAFFMDLDCFLGML